MIDFDALVLGPAQDLFARPVTVTPIKSQPGAPPFGARGIWNSKPVDVALADDGILSSQNHTLGIRGREYPIPLAQGDRVEIDAHLSLPRVGICAVEGTADDGQGDTTLTLKVIAP